MINSIPIIRTKFIPPLQKNTFIHRPTLIRKFKDLLQYRCMMIHSGPGYGKSTAISNFLYEKGIRFTWYNISKQDDDFMPFLTHLITSIQQEIPHFGEGILSELLREQPYNFEEEIPFICSEIINEFYNQTDDLVIVLDDFHLIEQSQATEKLVMLLLEHLPSNIHLVMSTRRSPDWEIITRMKVKGDFLEIKENDLAFTEEEVDVLFHDYYEMPLDAENIKQIHRLTEGWIIAIHMIWQQLKSEATFPSFNLMKLPSMDELFRYLTLEVFNRQPPMIQSFLEQTCIFEELTPELCDAVLQIDGSKNILEKLLKQHLFLISNGENQYRYHALFKDFLQTQLVKKNDQKIAIHQKSAHYFLATGNKEKALLHYLEIEDYTQIATILNTYGQAMIENGQFETLLEVLNKIPTRLKNQYFMLWFYEGEIHRYRCHYERALEAYKRTEKLAHSLSHPIGESSGLEGQGRIYLDTIQPGKASDFLKKAIDVLEEYDGSYKEKKWSLYGLMAENLLNLGKAIEAEQWYEKCKQIYQEISDSDSEAEWIHVPLEARIYLRTGRLREARNLLEKSKNSGQDYTLSRSHRETDLLLSIVCGFMGEGEIAKKLAQTGILQGNKRKAPFVEACGWIRMGHAVQILGNYEIHTTAECYETALKMMDEINISRGKAEGLMGLCLLYGNHRQYAYALEMGVKALEETERVADLWLSTYIRLSIAIAHTRAGDLKKAKETLLLCVNSFNQCNCQYGLLATYYWLASTAYDLDDRNGFKLYMEAFLKTLKQEQYEFFIEKRTPFGPVDVQNIIPILLEAAKHNIDKSFTCQVLERLGLKDLSFHPGYTLHVQMLGEFNVRIGAELVNEKDWKREKAKELFQLFLTRKNTLIPKSEILELLWAENDEESAARDFKVALNALNKAIEPNRQARSVSFFIKRNGSTYGLNEEASIQIDRDLFANTIEKGIEESDHEKAIVVLQQGLAMYKGDYLPNKKYEDWSSDERERLRVLFLRGSEKLAQLYVAAENFDEAMYWCNEILQKDPCWEEAYRLLMYCYYRKNNRAMAIRIYEKCKRHLEMELGVPPLETTIQMLGMIKEANRF